MIQDIDNSFTVILYTEISYKSAVIFSKFFFHFTDKFLLITKDFFTIWDFFSKNSKEVWTGYLISFEITIIRTTKVKTMKKKWLQAIENSAVSNKVICKLVILIKNCKFCS